MAELDIRYLLSKRKLLSIPFRVVAWAFSGLLGVVVVDLSFGG